MKVRLDAFVVWLHERRLDHALFGLVIQGAESAAWCIGLTLAGLPWPLAQILAIAIGWRVNVQHWFSREVRDVEIKLRADLPREFLLGWDRRNWHEDSRKDFDYPALAGLAVAALAIAVLRICNP